MNYRLFKVIHMLMFLFITCVIHMNILIHVSSRLIEIKNTHKINRNANDSLIAVYGHVYLTINTHTFDNNENERGKNKHAFQAHQSCHFFQSWKSNNWKLFSNLCVHIGFDEQKSWIKVTYLRITRSCFFIVRTFT